MPNLVVGVDNGQEVGLQRRAAYQETINIGALGELGAVGRADRAAVQDADAVGNRLRDIGSKPLADIGVRVLRATRKTKSMV